MLKALHIRNVVLIDQLTLDFKAGLSADGQKPGLA